MDFYGNINLNDNTMKKMVMETENTFPATPKVGRIVFKDGIVYICAALDSNNDPVWVPLTRRITTYVHVQDTVSSSWSVNHNLNTTNPLVQVWDSNNQLVIPDNVEIIDNNNLQVTFTQGVIGRVIVMMGTLDWSGGVLKPELYTYNHTQSTASDTWVIIHGLGYHPLVRAYDANGDEINPQSIVHDSTTQVTLTFTSAITGSARLV